MNRNVIELYIMVSDGVHMCVNGMQMYTNGWMYFNGESIDELINSYRNEEFNDWIKEWMFPSSCAPILPQAPNKIQIYTTMRHLL